MRTIAAAVMLGALAISVYAQRVDIRWEPTGGPIVGKVRQIIVQQRRLLLLSEGGEFSSWWRSHDAGETWDKPSARGPRPWIVGASERFIYGDTQDGIIRSSDLGDSWTRCGTLPINRTIGNDVRSIAANGNRVYVSVLRIGIFRSDDQCDTWTQLVTPMRADISRRTRELIGRAWTSGHKGTQLGSHAVTPCLQAQDGACLNRVIAGDPGRLWGCRRDR
jgi:hypothetical protein